MLEEKPMPYAHSLPNGAVVVVLDVPTFSDEDGSQGFSPDVAERLFEILQDIEAQNPPPGQVVAVRFPEGLEVAVEERSPEREAGTLRLHLAPFCGVRGRRPQDGMALRVALEGGQEILWDGSRLYWEAQGKRLPLFPLEGSALFFLGVWEGDGSFRLLFSPSTSEFPEGEILALWVGDGWLEAERWRKGEGPFPAERIEGRMLRLSPRTPPEEVASFLEGAWGAHLVQGR